MQADPMPAQASPREWARLYQSYAGKKSYLRMGAVPDDEAESQLSPIAGLDLPSRTGLLDYTEATGTSAVGEDRIEVLGGDRVHVVAGKRRQVVGGGESLADQPLEIPEDAAACVREILASGALERIAGGHRQSVVSGDQRVCVEEGAQSLEAPAGNQSFEAGGAQTISAEGNQTVTLGGTLYGTFKSGQTITIGGTRSLMCEGTCNETTLVRLYFAYTVYTEIGAAVRVEFAGFATKIAWVTLEAAIYRVTVAGNDQHRSLVRLDHHVAWIGMEGLEVLSHPAHIQTFKTACLFL